MPKGAFEPEQTGIQDDCFERLRREWRYLEPQ